MGMAELPFMSQNKAFVKLAWVIPQAEGNMTEVQKMMRTNYVGELNYMNKNYFDAGYR